MGEEPVKKSKSQLRREAAQSSEKSWEEQEAERLERESKIDNANAQRSTTYDQEVVRLARQFGLNPDNFETEEELRAGVEKAQALQAEADQRAEDEKIKSEEGDQ